MDDSPSPEQDPFHRSIRLLHICPKCDSKLVQPEKWEPAGSSKGSWQIWLRCPDCEHRTEGVFGAEVIDAYDEELDDGTAELNYVLKDLERKSMTNLVEVFAVALETDLIQADDFRPR